MTPESAEDFYARALAATDAERRLPLNAEGLVAWSTFPYETDGLQMVPLAPLSEHDMVRGGEDPATCWCAKDPRPAWAVPVWENQNWILGSRPSALPFDASLKPKIHADLPDLPRALAEELGWLATCLAASIETLPSVGRAHVCKWGDGGAHLHLAFLGRPARMLQTLGSYLPDWGDHLPQLPDDVWRTNLDYVLADFERRLAQ